jgi:PAS domain S-box-containing protein
VNKSGLKLLGISEDEQFINLAPEETILWNMDGYPEILLNSFTTQQETNEELVHKTDDRVCTYYSHFVPLLDESTGKLVKMLNLLFDITPTKDFEKEILDLNLKLEERVKQRTQELFTVNEELKKYADRISDLYHNAPVGYQSLDKDGKYISINKTAAKLLGYPREYFSNAFFQELLTEESKEIYLQEFKNLKEQGKVFDLELELIKKDGSILPILINSTAVMDENNEFVMTRSAFLDNSELKRIKDDLARRSQSLELANKELESFSYSISHDLRAPLRSMSGFARILLNEYTGKLDSEGVRLLGIISDNAIKMGQLIDDLLEFSRLGRKGMHKTVFNMEQLVRPLLLELIRDNIPDKPIETDISALPDVCGDPQLLKQVWVNLLSNAIKFSKKQEKIILKIGYSETEFDHVFSIQDNGVGFNMDYSNKLFGVFQRLHSVQEFEGTGVGLAIVNRIVTSHNGRVWAESIPGDGASFYFSLPKQAQ